MTLPDELINELTHFIKDKGTILIMTYHKKMAVGMRYENEIMRLVKSMGIDWNTLLVKNNATLGNACYVEMCDFAADFIIKTMQVVE